MCSSARPRPAARRGVVGDRERLRTGCSRRAHNLDQIRRAAALADADDERVGQIGTGAVDRDRRRRREAGRDAEADLGQVGAVERGVVGRAASSEDDVLRARFGDAGGHRGDGAGVLRRRAAARRPPAAPRCPPPCPFRARSLRLPTQPSLEPRIRRAFHAQSCTIQGQNAKNRAAGYGHRGKITRTVRQSRLPLQFVAPSVEQFRRSWVSRAAPGRLPGRPLCALRR